MSAGMDAAMPLQLTAIRRHAGLQACVFSSCFFAHLQNFERGRELYTLTAGRSSWRPALNPKRLGVTRDALLSGAMATSA